MSRPITISDDTILRAARRVFFQHGFKAATSKIAREAGVSEGTLFKRFKTKAQLFLEAMHNEAGELQWMKELAGKAGDGTVRDNLVTAATRIMDHLETAIPRMMTLRASGVRLPHPSQLKHRPPPQIQAEALTDYLQREISLGRLTMPQPHIHSHMIIGALLHYAMNKQHSGPSISPRAEFIAFVIDLHLGSNQKAAPKN